MKRTSATAHDKPNSKRYDDLKRELASRASGMGFVLTGSLRRRFFECSRDNHCRCHDDPANRHGPYYYWTRTVKGKTVSVGIRAEQVDLFRECIENGRALEQVLKRLRAEASRVLGAAVEEQKDGLDKT